jgi:secreted trypsin-like serine protease
MMSRAKICPALAALLLGACFEPALDTDEAYVIGGAITADGEFPGVGALMYDFGGEVAQGCTGTLIAPTAVLTAAHCVDPELTGPGTPGFSLALDTTNGNTGTVTGLVAYKHESFSLDGEPIDGLAEFFDIGVVILSQPITTVEPVKMIRPEESAALIAGLDLAIVGYGRTSNATQDTGIMYDAMTKLISLNATEIQVGMGLPQPQNCQGDSGGPALADLGGGRRVVGVVSRSFSGFECTMGGVDTRVDAYLSWIHGKVPEGIPCGSGLSEPCDDGMDPDDEGGCCSTSRRGGPGAALLALLVGLVVVGRPRRRRR